MSLKLSQGLRDMMLGITPVNILTNGAFASNITGWTNTLGAAYDGGAGANSTTGFMSTTSNGSAGEARYTAALTVIAEHWYRISLWFQKVATVGSDGLILIGTTAGAKDIAAFEITGTTAFVKKSFEFQVPAATTTIYLTLKNSSVTSTNVCNWDEVLFGWCPKSMQELFYRGFVKIYSGSQVTSANDMPSGTLLSTIYSDGATTGLTFNDSTSGVLIKTSTETWSQTAATATGTAGCFVLVTANDPGGTSTTAPRIHGTVATSGADMNMSSTTIAANAPQSITDAQFTMPSS